MVHDVFGNKTAPCEAKGGTLQKATLQGAMDHGRPAGSVERHGPAKKHESENA